jgi:hypothetical protein
MTFLNNVLLAIALLAANLVSLDCVITLVSKQLNPQQPMAAKVQVLNEFK